MESGTAIKCLHSKLKFPTIEEVCQEFGERNDFIFREAINYYLSGNDVFEETNYSHGLLILSDRGKFVLSSKKNFLDSDIRLNNIPKRFKTIYAISGILDHQQISLAAEVSFIKKNGGFEKEIRRLDYNPYWFLTGPFSEEEKCRRGF